MDEKEYSKLNSGDIVKLKSSSSNKFGGRFNNINKYNVVLTRNGKMIIDESGIPRVLNNIYRHFYTA